MSHVADVELQITDLEALDAACQRLGLDLRRGQRTHAWWGRFLNDWSDASRAAVHKGRDPKTFGKCDHAIGVKGATPRNGGGGNWEIGLVKRADGKGYDAVYDAYAGGGGLEKVAGKDLRQLKQEYGAEVAMRKLKAQRYNVRREINALGQVVVTATRRGN